MIRLTVYLLQILDKRHFVRPLVVRVVARVAALGCPHGRFRVAKVVVATRVHDFGGFVVTR